MSQPGNRSSRISMLSAKVDALEELLSVHEQAVIEQSNRLGHALAELRHLNAELEQRVRDRTLELTAANQALTEQVERWRVTLASIGDGVIVADNRGVIVTLNATAEQLTGWSAGQAAGRKLEEIFVAVNEDTGLLANNPAARTLSEGVTVNLPEHTVLVARDGIRRPVADSAAPIIDSSGKVLGVVLAFRDVTEHRRTERDREKALEREREARRRLEALNRAKDDFLSVLSHELRTPLTSIVGWAALMRTGRLDAAGTRRAIEVIERSAGVQTRLITDLLDASSMLIGRLTLEKRPVELGELTRTAAEVLQPAAAAAGIRLLVGEEVEALVVEGDSLRLQQVVHNLVANAIKFTPGGGTVRISVSHEGGWGLVRVQDTGVGIAPDFLPHIFERFSQADSTIRRRYQGVGLGLFIVRHLVELHGGHVDVGSPGPNRGSTFTISLPLAAPEGVPASESAIPAVHAVFRDARLDGLRVLVVEDDANTLELIAETLQRLGASVAAAADASEALAKLDRFRPDVLVGDIGLPGQDGFELMRSIRTRDPEHGGAVPAIALTAYVQPEDRDRAIESGYQIHLSKPIDLNALAASVRDLALGSKT